MVYGDNYFMTSATDNLPQALLKQYEQMALKYATVCEEREHLRNINKALEEELQQAEELLVRYESISDEFALPHHINHGDG
jgi:phosphoenolpyruvate carboxylase